MKRYLILILRDGRASSAAEFALVLPLLLIFLLGIIDVGRLMWTWNQAEKATQMGVRYAIVTNPVWAGMKNFDFVATGNIVPGETVPNTLFGKVTCSWSNSCDTCVGSFCSAAKAKDYDSAAFSSLVSYMKKFYPGMVDSADPTGRTKVLVTFSNSGLGYAGDPTGAAVAPLVTVSLQNVSFKPFFLLSQQAITLPPFQSSLTFEDGQGSQSN
jgi:Flp pilus assembly protein TadG